MIRSTAAPTLEEALKSATDTRCLKIGTNILGETPRVFRELFGSQPAVIVAAENTFNAAGRAVLEAFKSAGLPVLEPFIFRAPDLYAEHRFVEQLEASLKTHAAIPVAVGSGTINDLTKLASHRLGRKYMSVATAASMDGYTAFGASITFQGSKQTFLCPAPVAVLADLDVIRAAPGDMNSWGYADLIAKVTAGADWILADALGVEKIDAEAWAIAQGRLRENVSDPAGVPARSAPGIGRLVEGLMLGGFAMQACQTSRAASGAEHQFSHLWDMQHHTHNGRAPSHGFKVGIGTLAVTAFYERLLQRPIEQLDVDACCAKWPTREQWQAEAKRLFPEKELQAVTTTEIAAKHIERDALRAQLLTLRSNWPALREKLQQQLMPFAELRAKLQAAGATVEPEQIGISRQRLHDSFRLALFLRRRFTILDVAARADLFDSCVEEIFSANGPWPLPAGAR